MSSSVRSRLKYIVKNVPEYKINTNINTFNSNEYLKDKIVLITGGSKGIGFEIARRIIESGGKVIITARNKDELNQAKIKLGDNCYAKTFDITNINRTDDFLETITKEVGFINCLINNAGVSLHENDFLEVTEEKFDTQVSINFKGTYFMCQSYIKYIEKYKITNSNIINVLSETAGQYSFRPYGLTKAALASFTKWLAQAYILKGIRVNGIAPGVTETSMTNYYTKSKEVNNFAVGKRVLKPIEIAEIVCFLISDASSCISGQIIGCNEANVCFDNVVI